METNEEKTTSDEPLPPLILSRVQFAVERITTDPALTEDLTDHEALPLLNWAQTEVERLVLETAAMDEDDAWCVLDPELKTLRRYIRCVSQVSANADDPAETLHTLLASPPDYSEEM